MFFITVVIIIALYLCIDRVIRYPKVDNFSKKHILVTGCDKGFGRELVEQLERMGFPVFAACLTENGITLIKDICTSRVVPLLLDITKTDSIQAAYAFVKENLPEDTGLWAVVNNAGVIGSLGPSEMCSMDDYRDTCAVNLFGPIEMAKTFAPLVRKSQGRMIITTSAGGRCPSGNPTYTISKSGLEGFCDVLRREMAKSRVKVSVVEPGTFNTSMMSLKDTSRSIRRIWNAAPVDVQRAYTTSYLQFLELMGHCLATMCASDTHTVINAYVDAITSKRPRARYVAGIDAKLIYIPASFYPEWLSDYVIVNNASYHVKKASREEYSSYLI